MSDEGEAASAAEAEKLDELYVVAQQVQVAVHSAPFGLEVLLMDDSGAFRVINKKRTPFLITVTRVE